MAIAARTSSSSSIRSCFCCGSSRRSDALLAVRHLPSDRDRASRRESAVGHVRPDVATPEYPWLRALLLASATSTIVLLAHVVWRSRVDLRGRRRALSPRSSWARASSRPVRSGGRAAGQGPRRGRRRARPAPPSSGRCRQRPHRDDPGRARDDDPRARWSLRSFAAAGAIDDLGRVISDDVHQILVHGSPPPRDRRSPRKLPPPASR
jgi:hypothetical protein